jgi:hypothetical protein
MPVDILVNIGASAAAGIIYGAVGYFKNKKQEEVFDGFDYGDFSVSVICSAAIGGAATYMGMTPDAFAASTTGVMVYQMVKKAISALFQKKK